MLVLLNNLELQFVKEIDVVQMESVIVVDMALIQVDYSMHSLDID
jgi:hypothetical protein